MCRERYKAEYRLSMDRSKVKDVSGSVPNTNLSYAKLLRMAPDLLGHVDDIFEPGSFLTGCHRAAEACICSRFLLNYTEADVLCSS